MLKLFVILNSFTFLYLDNDFDNVFEVLQISKVNSIKKVIVISRSLIKELNYLYKRIDGNFEKINENSQKR